MTRLAALASAPRRMRADLRRATRPLRALPLAGAPLGDVGTALPPALFGGELLDVLSERLRELLAPPAPEPVIAPLARPGSAVGSVEWPDGLRPAGASCIDASGRAAREEGVAPAAAASPRLEAAPIAAAAPPRRGPITGESRAGRGRRVAWEGPLAERVRRYWRAVDAEEARARGHSMAPLSLPDRGAAGDVSEQAATARGAAPLPDAEVASALGAFVAGELFAPALARSTGHGEPAFGGRVLGDATATPPSTNGHGPRATGAPFPAGPAWPRPGAAGGSPSRAAALRGLADDVGDILREQALRHGIDVP